MYFENLDKLKNKVFVRQLLPKKLSYKSLKINIEPESISFNNKITINPDSVFVNQGYEKTLKFIDNNYSNILNLLLK